MNDDALFLATVGLVIVTLLLALGTLALWWEARRQRVEASVIASVAPWELAGGLYVAILIDNAGPSIAREVTVSWKLDRPVGAVEGSLKEAMFGAGFRRTILPIRSGSTMDQLAAEFAKVHVDLTWKDGRRGTQRQSLDTTVEAIRGAYADSGALPRTSMIEAMDQIRDAIKEIAKKP